MKSSRWTMLIVTTVLLLPLIAHATPQVITSGVARVNLLELYTSEGCSSCPPAEGWLSTLTGDKRLWTQLVPVAFHVDYWDNLGWRDPFDSHVYTERQQQLAAHAGNGVVYTPEFMLNGEPWTDWFNLRPLILPHASAVGRLTLTIDGAQIIAKFAPVTNNYKSLVLHVAVLAFGVNTNVGAGENAGRELRHDFLVIGYGQHLLAVTASGFSATVPMPYSVGINASRYALATWVSVLDDPTPIQNAGGWLASAPRHSSYARLAP